MPLFSDCRGTGRPLVLLHAFPLAQNLWDGIQPPPGFQLILPDFPGFGASPLASSGFTLGDAAEELKKHLENMDLASPIALGGISMGGYWALEFLRRFPGLVESLILVSTRAGADSPEGRQKRLDIAEKVEREGTAFLAESMISSLIGQTTREKDPSKAAWAREWILKAKPEAVALAQRTMAGRRDQTDLLQTIAVKTLVMAGREDSLIPPAEGEKMAAAISKSRLEIFPGLGHLLPLENPPVFQKSLDDFLGL